MARPKPHEGEIKTQLLDAAERLLARFGPSKVRMTEIAAECGMSQSNAYRYYPSKQRLMAAIAARWFGEVEAQLTKIAQGEGTPQARLKRLLQTQHAMKIKRYDQDPALFQAYLDLAVANPEAVAEHSERLSGLIQTLISKTFGVPHSANAEQAIKAQAILDATLLVRDPWFIARFRSSLSQERIDALIDLAITSLD